MRLPGSSSDARPFDSLRLVGRHAWPFRRSMVIVAILSIIGSIAEASTLLVLVALATTLARDQTQSFDVPLTGAHLVLSVGPLVAVGSVLALVRVALQLSANAVAVRASQRFEVQRKRELYTEFLAADWPTQSLQTSGAFHELMITDVDMGRVAIDALVRFVVAAGGFLIMAAFAVVVSWQTALAMFLIAGLLAFVVAPLSRRTRVLAGRRAVATTKFADELSDTLGLVREVRTFGATAWFTERLDRVLLETSDVRGRIEFVNGLVSAVYQGTVLLAAVLCLGAIYLVDPALVTSVGPVVLLLLRSMSYSQVAQQTLHLTNEQAPHLARMDDKRRELQAAVLSAGDVDLAGIDVVALDRVSFAYTGRAMALDDVSFRVRRGELVGVVGPSGAGKSTLIHLLLRLRRPDSGRLLVNGIEADSVSLDSWYRHLAFVPQEPVLLDTTVAENIRFGRTWIDDAAVRSAAVAAGIDAEVRQLPSGYETVVGEGGRQLSGGQRQRVCIARALAGSPDLLVFDEPTSALDAHSEFEIRRTLASLRSTVGVVLVAHRPSTLDVCDRMVVIVGVAVAAEGTVEELRASGSYFDEILRLAVTTPTPAPLTSS